MYNEMKKFYKNPMVMILLIVALILSILVPIYHIFSYENLDYSTGAEVETKGLDAFQARKEQIKKTEGLLDTKKFNDTLALYKSLPPGQETDQKVETQYPEVPRFIHDAYVLYGKDNSFSFMDIPNADDFYSRNITQIKGKIKMQGDSFSALEMQEIEQRAAAIKKPYQYEFVDHWHILFLSLAFVYAVIIFSALFISSQLFSFEKEKNMDLILHAGGRKRLTTIGYHKVFAIAAYLTIEFILCSMIVSAIIFGVLGVSGWNSQLQVLSGLFMSIFSWSIGHAFLLSLVISWLCIISIALISALVNSIFQKTYITLMISAGITLAPLFLCSSNYLPNFIKKALHVFPVNGISCLSYLDSLFIYNVGFMKVLTSTVIVIFAIGCILICTLLSPKFFAKRINR